MHIRFLTLAATCAALVVPVGAHAATLAATSSPWATPVNLTWNATAVVSETLYRSPGACVSLPMAPQVVVASSNVPTLDTSASDPVGDGTWCYYVQDDAVGFSNPVQVHVDLTNPTATITSPPIVHTTNNAVTANASDDASGVDNVAFEWSADGNAPWNPISADSTAPYTADWPTDDGAYFVHAIVTDTAGNSSTSANSALRVDTHAPAVSMISPAGSSLVQGASVSVSASATDVDGSGVTGVTFMAQLGAGSPFPIGSDSSGSPYSITWDTTGISDGLYSVWAVATDAATLTADSAHVTGVRMDNGAPTVSMVTPTASSNVHGTSVTLSANASDVSGGTGVTGVEFFTQLGAGTPVSVGVDTTATGSTYSFPWNTTGVADGVYSVWAVASDGATHSTSAAAVGNVRVDNAPPSGTLDAPLAGAVLHGATNGLSVTATDATGSGIQSVVFERSTSASGPWTTVGTSASVSLPYAFNWDTTGISAALFVRAVITDAAGNPFLTPAVSVVVDNTVPGTPGTPTGFTTVQSAPSFTFTAATDPGGAAASGVDHYNVFRDGGTIPVGSVVAPATTFVDAVGLANGFHTYTVVAVDKAGNSSVASGVFTVFLDSAAISAPTSVAALATPTNQHPQISWVAPAAPGFTIDHYDIFRVGVTPRVGFVPSTVTSFTDGSALPDNTYAYVVVAVSDTAFSGIPSGAVGIVYDTTAPGAPGSVSANAALDGSVNVAWAASGDGAGSGIAKYVVRRSSSSVPPATIADGDATCQVTATSCADSNALNAKLYSYAVFAVDRAGNTSVAGSSQPVTARDQTPPAVPTGLSATPRDGSVSLSWTPAGADGDVAGYALVAKQGTQAPTSDSDGLRVCTAIIGSSTTCDAGGLTNGAVYTFGLFALDEALNRSQPAVVSSTPNGKVDDTVATAAVSKLTAKVAGNKVTLTWKNPADHDFDHVVITASTVKPSANKAGARVYSGKGTKATIKLSPGQSRWFVLVAYDAVGNASPPASIRARIKAVSPFGPAPKAKVHGRVRLSWPTVKGARYYNVQIFAGKKRVAVGWPGGRSLVVPRAKLHKGVKYTWYVWPGLGAKAKAHYGKLIGKNVFTFTG